jgi:hypothetical protein
MTENVLQLWPEILAVGGGSLVLLLFALALGLSHRQNRPPGRSGHRPEEESGETEEIGTDGYIDSFAGVIEEAGGGMPIVVKLALPGILIWWFVYLILNWAPR